MSTKYELGTVAMVKNQHGVWNRAILTLTAGGYAWRPGCADTFYHPNCEARPLVVIDPEDASGDVARLRDLLTEHGWLEQSSASSLPVILREYANPTPPIKEPIGLGAVVREGTGLWVLSRRGYGYPWRAVNGDDSRTRSWASFSPDVEVLHEGYTPEAQS